jgi:hypothetical protein
MNQKFSELVEYSVVVTQKDIPFEFRTRKRLRLFMGFEILNLKPPGKNGKPCLLSVVPVVKLYQTV